MKLFYHFLIFVFASLILVACANIFTTNPETKTLNHEPSEVKHNHNNQSDSAGQANKRDSPYVITSLNYRSLLKGKRWTDNQCNIVKGCLKSLNL